MSHLSIEPSDPSRERGDARSADDHISGQRLAALADEQPTTDEQDHLSRCGTCSVELEAHRSLFAMAGSERGLMGIPLTRWDALAERLRAEGLMAKAPESVTAEWAAPIGTRRLTPRAMMRVAAAIMLVAGGMLIGRASTGAPLVPGGLTGNETHQTAVRPFAPNQVPTTFATVEEAQQWKTLYAAAYQNAVSFLAANDSVSRPTETPAVMRARLSALDRVSRTMREALNDAPYDPVINDFYLNSFGQREATLRQLNAVLPQGVRMNGF